MLWDCLDFELWLFERLRLLLAGDLRREKLRPVFNARSSEAIASCDCPSFISESPSMSHAEAFSGWRSVTTRN
jgi:hypothetical protein